MTAKQLSLIPPAAAPHKLDDVTRRRGHTGIAAARRALRANAPTEAATAAPTRKDHPAA